MKNKAAAFRTFLAWAAAGAVLWGATAPAFSAERGPRLRVSASAPVETEARVIVKFKADSALARIQSVGGNGESLPQHAQTLSRRLGVALVDGRALSARSQVIHAQGLSSADLAARLGAQAEVEYAVPDERKRPFAAPNDPLYAAGQSSTPVVGQWYLHAPSGSTVSAINAEEAWAITTGKSSVVVAVLDTGVRPEHPDLQGKLLPGYDFVADAASAADGGGRDADPSDPGDGVIAADVPVNGVGGITGCTASDVGTPSSWHGTETAGLVGAATNNGVGMASVGHDVKVLPLRVFGKCGGYDSDIQAAMRWAAGLSVPGLPMNPNPAKVLNMSLGGLGACSQSYADVIAQLTALNIVLVVAAGNEGLAVTSPANCVGVIAVGGVRHTGTKVGYSNLGPEVTISAPAGNCVNTASGSTCLYPLVTTSNDGVLTPGASVYSDGDIRPSLGTSFSTPLVAGTAALMLSANATLTPAQIIAALKSTARPFPSTGAANSVVACVAPSSVAQGNECYCTTSTCGAGLLDVGAAVAKVAVVNARIAVASTSAVAGTAVTFDGGNSSGAAGRAISSYAWSITAGAGIASFSSATNAATATLLPSAAGTVTVSLTVTDSGGLQDTNSTTLQVSAAAVAASAPAQVPVTTSSGGGGAMEFGWLLGWLASVIGVWVVTPARKR